jgi:hypothetical protein
MSTLRLKHLLTPLIAVRAYTRRVTAAKHERELRQLQRRVAAARLGLG